VRRRERRKWRDDFVDYNIVISGEHIRYVLFIHDYFITLVTKPLIIKFE